MKLTFKMVECFKTVMAVGTVTAAAEVLCTSQPAVSRSISQLETAVGIHLFDRVKGRLLPTAHAHTLLAEVNKTYRGLEHLERAASSLKSFQNGNISVVCAPAFSEGFIGDVAASFLSKYGDVSLTIDTQQSWAIAELINEQKFDLGITAYEVSSQGAACEPFCAPDEVCVMPSDHPLAQRPIIDPVDLDGVSCVFLSERDPYRRRLDRVFETTEIRRRLVIETPNTNSACAMVTRGCGVAVVSPLTALDFVNQGLTMRRFSAGEPFHSTLLRAKHRPTSPLIDMFVAELKSIRDANLARVEEHLTA
ncbi:LysR family transcriptional regulator [Mesorhizobium sp. NPDC059054]|uniref:LysR family transcriptional regulator n=1 Tax=Mesorhizobium sp. NPDC059054 TaxID=3346711 RepID=UPI003688D60F